MHTKISSKLITISDRLFQADQQMQISRSKVSKDTVQLEVLSFSYQRGIPKADLIFNAKQNISSTASLDYRLMPMSGMDEPVKRAIEQKPEVEPWIKTIIGEVKTALREKMQQGGGVLVVAAGCMGGRHRSVYTAERIADYFRGRSGVTVSVQHREQPHWATWEEMLRGRVPTHEGKVLTDAEVDRLSEPDLAEYLFNNIGKATPERIKRLTPTHRIIHLQYLRDKGQAALADEIEKNPR